MLYIILMHISCFIGFFANDISCCVFYVYFRLGKLFFLSSKWVVKQGRQLLTSTMHLAQEPLMNIQGSGGSRSFAKKRLEDEECSGWPSDVTMTNWEPSSKLILLQLHEKLPKNSTSTILWLFNIWSKLERWKKLNKWMPHELIKKIF